jgi:hypothetical protein
VKTTTLLGPALALLAGCLPEAPEQPTWAEDVWPILRTACIRCHSGEAIDGAPPTFRLDRYEDAAKMARYVGERAGVQGEMPPGGPELNAYQRKVLENWGKLVDLTDTGAPVYPPDGYAARGNAAPTITIRGTRTEGDVLVVSYLVEDADADTVTGTLGLGAADGLKMARIRGGAHEARLDLGQVEPGSYQLAASLDDGHFEGGAPAAPVLVENLGAVEVSHENTAPFIVSFFAEYDIYTDATPAHPTGMMDPCAGPQCAQVFVQPCNRVGAACDEPGDTYTASLVGVAGTREVALATDVPVTPGAISNIAFDPALLAEGPWRLRVTVSDGVNTRSATTSFIHVGHRAGMPTPTWADVKPIFDNYCVPCHAAPRPPHVPVDVFLFADDPGTPEDEYADSARAALGGTYNRVVLWRSMPPPSAETLLELGLPSGAERKLLADWILGGAP